MVATCDAAVVGAGPHGLATAAHLRAAGFETRVLGRPMSLWREHMPATMLLRSRIRASSIASPVDGRLVAAIEPQDGRFELILEDGARLSARRVVVAAGIAPFAHRPEEFSGLPPALASHALDHRSFAAFEEQRVLVIGAGQSALDVEVVVRAPGVRWLDPPRGGLTGVRRLLHELQHPPTAVGPRGLNWIAAIPDLFRLVPRPLRGPIGRRCIAPAGADWLCARLADVPITIGRRVVTAARANGQVRVELDDASVRRVDHVLLATGYRVDLARYPFLPSRLLGALRMRNGYPVLSTGLETSHPGLHVVGAPAALSAGPIMRFVCGTWYAAPAVTDRMLGRRHRPLRRAW